MLASGAGFVGCGAGDGPSAPAPAAGTPAARAASARDLLAAGTVIELPSSSLTDQTGARFGSAQFDGRVWVAHLTFTRCREIGPDAIAALRGIRGELKGSRGWEDVQLVSFSVDPQHDTPQVLMEYSRSAGADQDHWKFLTGRPNQILQLTRHGLHLAVDPRADSVEPVLPRAQLPGGGRDSDADPEASL